MYFQTANSTYEIVEQDDRFRVTKTRDLTGRSPKLGVGDSRFGDRFRIDTGRCFVLYDGDAETLRTSIVSMNGITAK